MANTFTLIASTTVGSGGAASIDFTSIPSTYTDLVLKLSARLSVNDVQIKVNFNNDTTATNYFWRRLYGDGATVVSDNGNNAIGGSADGANLTANTFGNMELYIPNYTSSNSKSVSSDQVLENNATTAYQTISAFRWTGTAAINQITLTPNTSGNFAQYSTATLYGIKNS